LPFSDTHDDPTSSQDNFKAAHRRATRTWLLAIAVGHIGGGGSAEGTCYRLDEGEGASCHSVAATTQHSASSSSSCFLQPSDAENVGVLAVRRFVSTHREIRYHLVSKELSGGEEGL